MNKYLITSPNGSITLTYSALGDLIMIESDPRITEQRLQFVTSYGFTMEANLQNWTPPRNTSLEMRPVNASWDDFWAAYPKKVSKIEAHRKWIKMKDVDQQRAYNYLPQYIRNADRDQVAYLYPSSYLSARRWEDAQ